MVRIISDTSTLYSTAQAREEGFAVSPLAVTIAGKTYREFDEITSQEFVDIINQGHMPASSQPAIGEVTALYEEFARDEILNLAMADGLSGTYNSAVAAAQMCENSHKITVINTRTLCGPHRYLVQKAVQMARAGKTLEEIKAWVEIAVLGAEKLYGAGRGDEKLEYAEAFLAQHGIKLDTAELMALVNAEIKKMEQAEIVVEPVEVPVPAADVPFSEEPVE